MNASLKAGAESLMLQTVLQEMGEDLGICLVGDSAASKGMLSREGVGAVKHLHVRQLWLQERVSRGELKVEQVARAWNAADTLTHHWGKDAVAQFHRLGFEVRL